MQFHLGGLDNFVGEYNTRDKFLFSDGERDWSNISTHFEFFFIGFVMIREDRMIIMIILKMILPSFTKSSIIIIILFIVFDRRLFGISHNMGKVGKD